MSKIALKSELVLGTNYKYHLVDFQGVDIVVDVTGGTITSTTTDFSASSETAGIVKRAVEVGDVIKLSNTTSSANEGVTATVTSVAANSLGVTFDGAPIDESAGAEINIIAFRKTFQFLEAGALDFVDGVPGIIWASKTVDDWNTGNLDIYDSVFTSIEPRAKSIAAKDGWEPHDLDTLLAIRDTALEIRPDANSAATKIYALPRSGNLDAATDQFYYWFNGANEMTAPNAAVQTGSINQLVLIFDAGGSNERGVWNFRCLEKDKTHLQEQIDMQFAEIYTVGSGNGLDPKLSTTPVLDSTVSAGGIYANIVISVDVDSIYSGDVDGTFNEFKGFVDNDAQTLQVTHVKVHYQLRQPTNINDDGAGPPLRGDKQPPITSYLGQELTFNDYYPLNYSNSERNNIKVINTAGNPLTWPKGMTLTIVPDALATGGTFTVTHEDTFGASNATFLQNELNAQQRDIAMPAAVGIPIAYSTYNVDGHTSGTPIPVRISYNKPGAIEPRNVKVILEGNNITVNISSIGDPSYVAA